MVQGVNGPDLASLGDRRDRVHGGVCLEIAPQRRLGEAVVEEAAAEVVGEVVQHDEPERGVDGLRDAGDRPLPPVGVERAVVDRADEVGEFFARDHRRSPAGGKKGPGQRPVSFIGLIGTCPRNGSAPRR
jgi:hypothetical protein